MIVKTLEDVIGTKGEAHGNKWHSMRLLHAEDGMGVTLTDSILEKGFEKAVGAADFRPLCGERQFDLVHGSRSGVCGMPGCGIVSVLAEPARADGPKARTMSPACALAFF